MSPDRADSRRPTRRSHPIRTLTLSALHWTGQDDQPLKVFLHGWLDVAATWQRVVEHLPPDWRIAAPDQRGFGHSTAGGDTYWFYDYLGDLDQLLDHIAGDAPVDLIGHSMGSQVAALYAGVRPERIRRLVLLDGFYLPMSATDKAPGRLREWLDDLKRPPTDKIYPDLDNLATRIRQRQPALDADTARFVAECWSEALPDGRRRLLGDGRHRQRGPLLYRDEEARTIFRQVRAPTLFVDAGASILMEAAANPVRRARIECFAKRQEVTIADAGHMLHLEAPEQTAAHIQAFLQPAALPEG